MLSLADGAVAPCEYHPLILKKRNGLDPLVGLRVQGEGQVEPTSSEPARDRLGLLNLAQDYLDVRMCLAEGLERGRHELSRCCLRDTDADTCPLPAPCRVDVGADGFDLA